MKSIYISLVFILFWLLPLKTVKGGTMLITDRGARLVRIANLDGSDLRTLIPSAGSNVRGIAIDVGSGDLFYADNGADIIYRAKLDGTERHEIISSDLGFPADLTLDQDAGKVYWCDRDKNRIERSDYDGENRETVISTSSPYYLDLDLNENKIYWGDFSGGNIFRATLPNGTGIETIVEGLLRTRGVKIDSSGGYFYWCDRNTHKIQRRPIKGGEIEDLYTGLDTPHGMTLDIDAKKVYWVDTGTNSIDGNGAEAVSRGDMDGSGKQEVLASLYQPWDITLDTRVTNYGEWRARRFRKDAPTSVTGHASDPDQDQHNNLSEYFAGLNPLLLESTQPVSIFNINEKLIFAHRITKQPITDIRTTIETSMNLKDWKSDPKTIEELEPQPDGESLLMMSRVLPSEVNTGTKQVRLKIELIDR